MQHSWSVICSDISIDKDTNNITLFKTFERFAFSIDEAEESAAREPHGHLTLPLNFVLVTLWWRSDINEAETGISRLVVVTPNNEKILLAEVPVDLSGNVRTRNIGRLQGFPFHESGVYQVMVQYQDNESWNTVATIPLEIIQEPRSESDTQ